PHGRNAHWILSPECTSCLACVERCPQQDALKYGLSSKGKQLPAAVIPLLIVGVFAGGILIAKATGHWETSISALEYFHLIQRSHQIH
ncbi:MAG: 4Fe-4S binding protein, partial [Firmicutes bacterium]|nr:4Fe-4S binding protein [Bacillota bacterium]